MKKRFFGAGEVKMQDLPPREGEWLQSVVNINKIA